MRGVMLLAFVATAGGSPEGIFVRDGRGVLYGAIPWERNSVERR